MVIKAVPQEAGCKSLLSVMVGFSRNLKKFLSLLIYLLAFELYPVILRGLSLVLRDYSVTDHWGGGGRVLRGVGNHNVTESEASDPTCRMYLELVQWMLKRKK